MSDDDLIGKQFGEYRLETMLGQGGMARVYLASDVRLKRRAVIKVIDPPSRSDPDYMTRFEREAQIIGQLDHPNIVRLYRYDEQDGWLYMAMQHIEGADLGVMLADYRAEGTYIEPEAARRIIREIGAALDYAHKKGVIHRDVKPANILIDRQGKAFLSDFGLALMTEIGTRGEIFGSPHYMAPEQAVSSAKAVSQSDLYALGVILYEMFTGELPFRAERPLDIAFLQITEAPTPPSQVRPDVNPELETVILKALAKKPDVRYQRGAELADALDAALAAKSAAGLMATAPSAAGQSILARVALELDQAPLPLIPAAVAAPETQSLGLPQTLGLVPPLQHPVEKTDTLPPPRTVPTRKPMLYAGLAAAGGILILLALLCVGVFALPSLLNNFRAGANPAIASPTESDGLLLNVTATRTRPPAKKRATITPSQSAAPVVAPSATATPMPYRLVIFRDGMHAIFIVNRSDAVFSLGLLSLSSEGSTVNGTEWGLSELKKGQCVSIWKEEKKGIDVKLPRELVCSLVGPPVVREKEAWIGEKSLIQVSYNGKVVGSCDKKQKQCVVMIAVP